MSLSFAVSVIDTTGTYGAYTSLIQTDLIYAGSVWASYIDSNASIEVQINIAQTAGNTADGTAAFSDYLSSSNGLDYWRFGTIAEMLTGPDPNGASPDAIINIDPDYIEQWLYFDPNPSPTSVVPANKLNAVETFEHELGHAFGFNGFLDWSTALPAPNDYSTFDVYVTVMGGMPYFTGPAAEAVYGGPVPLTVGNLYHVGNSIGQPGSNLLNDLMNGVIGFLGNGPGVSALDLAILRDVGVPIKSNSVPTITSNGGRDVASVSIAENTTTVTTVTATDADAGQTLRYSISGGADASKFAISASTGALSFVTAPNFEAPTDADGNNVYNVSVQASDGNGGTDTQAIAVTVTDVFENTAPIIISNGGRNTAAVSTAENSNSVTTVTATDTDAGQTLSYSISGGADASKFVIVASTGALSFVATPNFEAPTDTGGNNVYDVNVQASDGKGGIDTQAIAVTVTDVFENTAPIIISNGGGNTAAVSIAENTTAVTTVTATDPDLGQTLSYSISGGADASKFAIDTSTGALSFVTAAKFELPADAGGNNIYDVIVQASDGHEDGVDTQAIAVMVTDVSEAPPAHRTGSVDLGSRGNSWPVSGVGDFNGDGTSDVLWRNPGTGQVDQWQLLDGKWSKSIDLGATKPANWQLAGVGDFNGDGTSDVVWRDVSNSQVDQWQMRNGNWSQSIDLGRTKGADWTLAGTGDFNGDGTSDVLWRKVDTSQVDQWEMKDGNWSKSIDLGVTKGSQWVLAGVGDFNGDGTDDILWRNVSTSQVDQWEMKNGNWSRSIDLGATKGADWRVAGIGDFNGDNVDDIMWQNTSSGLLEHWQMANGNWAGSIDHGSQDPSLQPAGVGDLNSDGMDEQLLLNPSTAHLFDLIV